MFNRLLLDIIQLLQLYISLYHFQLLELEAFKIDCPLFCCLLPALQKEGLLMWDSKHFNFGRNSMLINNVIMGLSADVTLKKNEFIW